MKQHLFGTNGIRSIVGQAPLTFINLPLLGLAIGQSIINHYGKNAQVLLAHDTRISCSFIKSALGCGLSLHQLTIYDANVLPTPAGCRLVQQNQDFKTGIIITASHNPYYDNGIKIIDENGVKIDEKEETEIEHLFEKIKNSPISYDTLGSIHYWPYAADRYIATICSLFPAQFLDGITIALDCANGATSKLAPHIFRKLGATVIPIHNAPDGININEQCGTQHTQDLVNTVLAHNADIGFAFDGDGDRLVIITKDGIKKDGDDMLALLASNPPYDQETTIIGTIMSNQGLEQWLASHKKKLIRCAVGEPAVWKHLKKHNLTLGGEPSGHIIMTNYLSSSDAIYTALRLLGIIITTNNWKLETFTHYPQINLNIPVTVKNPLDKPPLKNIIEAAQTELPDGRLIIRYSGTEPLLRVMVEGQDQKKVNQVAQTVAHKLKKELSTSGE